MFIKDTISIDLFSSFVVFLIALPLCLGVAIASGVDPIKGIFTGVIGGLVVGMFSGSPLQISGPSPGLAVMVLEVVGIYGADALIPLGIIVGAFQILTYLFKVAHFFQATPPSLLKALLSGIGALIVLAQVYIMFDMKMSSNGITNLTGIPDIFRMMFSGGFTDSQTHSGIIGGLVILILYLWNKGNHQIFELIPGPLVSILIAAVTVYAFGWEMKMIQLPENIFANAFNNDYAAAFSKIDMKFYPLALGLAFIASTESLLCVSAVDKMAKTSSSYNKTILAQGIGNLVIGLVGAIPVVGVIVRSAANIEFGAKTRLSSLMLGVWLGIFLLLPSVLSYIPIPALAGLLIFTGIKLLDISHIIDYVKSRNKSTVIFFTTFILTITVDLLMGVIAGFVVAMFLLVLDVLKFDLEVEEKNNNKVLKFKGKLSFLDLPVLSKQLRSQNLDDATNLEICLQEVEYLDPAISEHLDQLKDKLESQGTKIEIHYNKMNIH
jgi:MFS superfamily sulfate permease-like transporter